MIFNYYYQNELNLKKVYEKKNNIIIKMFRKQYFENIGNLIKNLPIKNDSFFFRKKNVYTILSKPNSIILQKIDYVWGFPFNKVYEINKNNIGLVDYENKEILSLYFIEEYREKGLGTFLMKEVEKKMKEEKKDSIHLLIHHNRRSKWIL